MYGEFPWKYEMWVEGLGLNTAIGEIYAEDAVQYMLSGRDFLVNFLVL